MYCEHCGNYLFDDYQFCIHCGAARPEPAQTPKGTRWVPVTLTILLFLLGLSVYYLSLYGNFSL